MGIKEGGDAGSVRFRGSRVLIVDPQTFCLEQFSCWHHGSLLLLTLWLFNFSVLYSSEPVVFAKNMHLSFSKNCHDLFFVVFWFSFLLLL